MTFSVKQVENATHALYAGGPWGEIHELVDSGSRAITDSHHMSVYRKMVRTVLSVAYAEPVTRDELLEIVDRAVFERSADRAVPLPYHPASVRIVDALFPDVK